MDDRVRLRIHAQEVRNLESRFAEDWIVRAVLAIDLAIRRAALAVITGGDVPAGRAGERAPGRTQLPPIGKAPSDGAP